MRKSKKYGIDLIPVVVSYEFDIEEYDKQIGMCFINGLSFMNFGYVENTAWLQFIINNRAGLEYCSRVTSDFHNLDKRFDIVVGRIADQNIALIVKEVYNESRKVTEYDLQNVIYKNKDYATQISFHTPNALKHLKLIGYEEVL